MFRFFSRITAMMLLALAVVMAMLDITRSITASALVMTPLLESWATISPATLEAARHGVETWTARFVWDPVLASILQLPSWLVLWLISMLLFWVGQYRSTGIGRFASR